MRRLAAVLVMIAAFAGCAGSEAGPPASTTDSQEPLDARVSGTQGAVVGSVTDDSQLPVPNATVRLLESGREGVEVAKTTSASDGAFAFPLLEPRTYRVTAEADGFGQASILVTIIASQLTEAKLRLADVPAQVPYTIIFSKVGRLSCAAALVVTPTAGSCPGESDSQFVTVFEVPDGFARILSEAVWGNSDMLAQYFYVDNETTNSGVTTLSLAEKWGKSPIRISFEPGEKKQTMSANPVFAGTFIPVPKAKFNFNITTYYAGMLADEFNATAGAGCKYVYGRCAGAGVAIDLRWTQYVSVFVNGLPADADTYSAIPRS